MGRNPFMRLVKKARVAEKAERKGSKNWFITHGSGETSSTVLAERERSHFSVALRTVHRHPGSLKSYQHLCR